MMDSKAPVKEEDFIGPMLNAINAKAVDRARREGKDFRECFDEEIEKARKVFRENNLAQTDDVR